MLEQAMPQHNLAPRLYEPDPEYAEVEEREWIDAFAAVLEAEGSDRARFLLEHLVSYAISKGVAFTIATDIDGSPSDHATLSELRELAEQIPASTKRASASLDRAIAAFERVGV